MWLIAVCLEGRAGITAEEGQLTWAAQLWGAADALRESIRVPIPLMNVQTTSAQSPPQELAWVNKTLQPRGKQDVS